uniref:Csu type fimbrial protein n=1 Tax=uncultured Caulobacter sp. TaxID=158749 RepID=UPI0025D620B2|nr:spore coat U domain-containing protein [uncultured Caulobacter sp.]
MRPLIARGLALALCTAPTAAAAQGACLVEMTGLDFGVYSGLSPAADTAIGRLSVRCLPASDAGTPQVRVGAGQSGRHLDRMMTSGTAQLRYNLYLDPAHRLIAGDGSTGTSLLPAPRTRAIGRYAWPLFGAIPAGQRVPAGVYGDTILIEIAF